jgi:DNA-binding MarR family transcriptional regulator
MEGKEPLRRRILQVLSRSPKSSSELAEELRVTNESVSRHVSSMRKAGLIESIPIPGDGRRKLHNLTAAGEVELSRHLAYGKKPEPVRPSREAAIEFLRSALGGAVEMRRQSNQLDEAEARLEVVLRESRKLSESELVVEALAELATTQRQNNRPEAVEEKVEELETIAMGKSLHSGSTLAMPALAHRQYALGRVRVGSTGELSKCANHLISAASIFNELAAAPQYRSSRKWKEREAWSIASLANNLRARSDYDGALEQTAAALRIFEELEDPYGRSHSLFQLGFCQRLLGDFDGAWVRLTQAQELAKAHSFERFQADSLMQIGEVLRCRGEIDEAQGVLEESRERSVRMGLSVTEGFAHSALGAVAFHRQELREAQMELQRAEQKFVHYKHLKGLALNSRRRAAVARLLSWKETKGEDLDRVEDLIEVALRHYKELHSPAGETACEIERGRLRILRDKEASGSIESLLELLEGGTAKTKRDLLELDPWVPRVLQEFAEETENRSLIDRAREFVVSADRTLGELARKSVRRAAAIIGRAGEDEPENPRRTPVADEMGGEARQELKAAEPIAA